jgi:hypothetical protein
LKGKRVGLVPKNMHLIFKKENKIWTLRGRTRVLAPPTSRESDMEFFFPWEL